MSGIALVTGATGNVGAAVVEHWPADSGVALRIALRRPEQTRAYFDQAHETAWFDFQRPETFAGAFRGVDRLFLVRPPRLANVKRDIAPAVTAARAAGVRHVVFLSLMGVENNRIVPHYRIEKLLEESGMAYTFLRAGFFMQNLGTTHRAEIRDRSEIIVPAGRSRTSFVDARDLGAVGAQVLTGHGHEGQRYTLTGAEALDYYQVAATLSRVLGRTIRYDAPSILRFVRYQRQQGTPWGYVLVMAGLYTITRFGNAAAVTPDVQHLLGRTPTSLQQYVEDHRALWQPAGPQAAAPDTPIHPGG